MRAWPPLLDELSRRHVAQVVLARRHVTRHILEACVPLHQRCDARVEVRTRAQPQGTPVRNRSAPAAPTSGPSPRGVPIPAAVAARARGARSGGPACPGASARSPAVRRIVDAGSRKPRYAAILRELARVVGEQPGEVDDAVREEPVARLPGPREVDARERLREEQAPIRALERIALGDAHRADGIPGIAERTATRRIETDPGIRNSPSPAKRGRRLMRRKRSVMSSTELPLRGLRCTSRVYSTFPSISVNAMTAGGCHSCRRRGSP